jgi:hypothetical protein
MFDDILPDDIVAFHDACLISHDFFNRQDLDGSIWYYIELNHRFNHLLWEEEDLARRIDVPDYEIAKNKRAIDRYNQQRNDATEKIDEALINRTQEVICQPNAWLSSETAGAMIDRLSILSLKIFHMHAQTLRDDADFAHIEKCKQKLNRLIEQRADLQFCLTNLFTAVEAGTAYFKVYRQFKMYNDPSLNPYLYRNNKSIAESSGVNF